MIIMHDDDIIRFGSSSNMRIMHDDGDKVRSHGYVSKGTPDDIVYNDRTPSAYEDGDGDDDDDDGGYDYAPAA